MSDVSKAAAKARAKELVRSRGLSPKMAMREAISELSGRATGQVEARAERLEVVEGGKQEPARQVIPDNVLQVQDEITKRTVSEESALGAGGRLQLGAKLNDAGKLNYLSELFGEDDAPDGFPRVAPIRDSETGDILRTSVWVPSPDGGGERRWADPAGSGSVGEFGKDVAEFVPDALEAGAGITGGILGFSAGGPPGAVAGGAIGDAVGNAARQGISALLPGSDELTAGQRLAIGGTSVAAGALPEVLGMGARGARGLGLTPTGFIESQTRKNVGERVLAEADDVALSQLGSKSPRGVGLEFIKESKRLSEDVGKPLSAGQATGDQFLLRLESYVRQLPTTANLSRASDLKRTRALSTFTRKTINATSENVGALRAGQSTRNAYDKLLRDLQRKRAQASSEMFAEARRATGNRRVVPLANTVDEIKRIRDDFGSDLPTDTAKPVLNKMREIEDALSENSKVRVQGLQNALSDWGARAEGTGVAVKDIDKATSIQISKRIRDALRADLDAAADGSGIGGVEGSVIRKAAKSLKGARDAWREGSEIIDQSRSDMLDHAIGLGEQELDKIPAKVWTKSLSENQVAQGMAILSRHDAATASKLRGEAMRELVGGAEISAGDAIAASEELFSPNKLAGLLTKHRGKIEALYSGDKAMIDKFETATRYAQRLGDVATLKGAQTTPLAWVGETVKALNPVGEKFSPGKAVEILGTALQAKKLHRILNSSEGMDALLRVTRPEQSSLKQFTAAATRLAAIANRADEFSPAGDEASARENFARRVREAQATGQTRPVL